MHVYHPPISISTLHRCIFVVAVFRTGIALSIAFKGIVTCFAHVGAKIVKGTACISNHRGKIPCTATLSLSLLGSYFSENLSQALPL
jgi:hypothetical protein